MVLYFTTKANRNGNKKQLVYDTDKKTVQKGCFLFGWSKDAVELTPKQLDRLFDIIFDNLQKPNGEGGANV